MVHISTPLALSQAAFPIFRGGLSVSSVLAFVGDTMRVPRPDIALVALPDFQAGIVDKRFDGQLDRPIRRRFDRFAPAQGQQALQ